MQYMLMICTPEAEEAAMDEAAKKAMYADYWKFTTEIRESGHYKTGSPLLPTSTATTVKVREGKTIATDGPFAETREQIGGFYIVEAADLDEAISIAARIPGARMGSIEVRPLMKF